MSDPAKNTYQLGSTTLEFPGEIYGSVSFGGLTMIAFYTGHLPRSDQHHGRNVHAFDKTGKLVWKIQPSGSTIPSLDGEIIPSGYCAVYVRSNVLKVYDFQGFEFDLDVETGEVSNIAFVK